jgi:LacI family transcriptional regulator
VAFDEAAWMEVVSPGVTAVAQPPTDMGREAAVLLLDRLAGDLSSRPVMRQLPTRFVRRESTAIARS